MNFRFPIDKDIQLNELDSKIINIIKNNDNNTKRPELIFDSNFYSFDGDGLIGRVTGLIEVESIS